VSYLLFADDNEDMRHMVRDLLESSGHEIALAADGPSALEAVRSREPDLLILDLNMPGLSGYDVCRAVKTNPGTSRVPVLMLTAQSSVEHKLEGFEAGADDYLPKPFDARELRARVSALLRLVRREADRNPTSGLPGGHAIDEELNARIGRNETFAVCYIDLDNFKPFADYFGFSVADQVIRETGDAIRMAVSAVGTATDFVGHIGGDDFIVITAPAHVDEVAKECATRFRVVVASAVGEESMRLGTFTAVDREGLLRTMPLACLSAAILTVRPEAWISAKHLGARAAELKRRAKARGPGTIVAEPV
jgi:PleD family two-component response regulator